MMKEQWWKKSVVYQIYPKSFMDSNGDGIGDIKGIISKLDYLRELGVQVIWISPMLASPMDDNGYDISDYQEIMSDFGTMEDYEELLHEAHRRGLKIVMDLVVNHTSDEHRWFMESKKSKDNPYRDYYIWKEGKDGEVPNNWGAAFGGSTWEYDQNTKSYYLHLFSKKQPDLNWKNPEVRNEVFTMMKWWCDKGVDGFRMDVISMIAKDPAYPDGKVKDGLYGDGAVYYTNLPDVHTYLKEMNQEVLSHYDLITVGETAAVTTTDALQYAGEEAGELNMVFQFEHVEVGDGPLGKWTTERFDFLEFKQILIKWQTELQHQAWNSNYLSNHDQPRSVSRFGNDSDEFRELSAKMLATMNHMLRGTPYIYQGEELGMKNAYFDKLERYRDIESINKYHEYVDAGLISAEEMMHCLMLRSRDNARTPMQWDDGENAGFTTGKPWIEVADSYQIVNAKEQLERSSSVFHYYQQLIQLRKEHEVIVHGNFKALEKEHPALFVFTRDLGEKSLLVICNFFAEKAVLIVPEEFTKKKSRCLISNYESRSIEHELEIYPYEATVFITSK